jgi:putative FmdB family regulatory protein
MPIYVYRCTKCGAIEEHIQRFSDPPMTKCESCKGKLVKEVTSAAFLLKGGGWYKDGYASTKPGADSSSGDGGSATSASTDSSPKADSKPDSKPATEPKPKAKAKAKGASK